MNKEIFREYDIRGIVKNDLDNDTLHTLGRAIGTYYAEKKIKIISLGRDCRLSSENMRNVLAKGLNESGIDIVDIGVCPTPLVYFSLFNLTVDGGIMITGSHNPPEYNGMKVCVGKETIYGEEIQKIRKIAEAGKFATGAGKITKADLSEKYVNYVTENIKLGSYKPKVVVDAGNGTGGILACKILTKLGISYIPLYCEMDGHFPNHHPDPTVPKYVADLKKKVLEKKYDLGVAYDGDADRIGVISDKGDMIWGDELMILFARDILKRKPRATFISEVKCSKRLYDDVEKHGGKIIMYKTGHSLIKNKMKETKAELAGEMSGHIFFKDRYLGYDDAVYSSMRLIEIVSRENKKVSELLSDLPKVYATPEIRRDSKDEIKFKLVDEVKKIFRAKYDVIDIDGVRILYPDGWGLVRASNTQPVLVLRFEAESEKRLNEIQKEVEKVLEDVESKL